MPNMRPGEGAWRAASSPFEFLFWLHTFVLIVHVTFPLTCRPHGEEVTVAAGVAQWDAESSGQSLPRKGRGWARLCLGLRPEKERHEQQHESSASSRSYSKEGRCLQLQGTSAAMLNNSSGEAAVAESAARSPPGMGFGNSSKLAGTESCTSPAFIATLNQVCGILPA